MRHTDGDVLFRLPLQARLVPCQLRVLPLFLLAGNRLRRALPGAGVRMGPLPSDRKASAVPQPAVAPEVHHPLDIHLNFAAQVTFHDVVAVDLISQGEKLGVGKILHALGLLDSGRVANLLRRSGSDSVYPGQCDRNSFSS